MYGILSIRIQKFTLKEIRPKFRMWKCGKTVEFEYSPLHCQVICEHLLLPGSDSIARGKVLPMVIFFLLLPSLVGHNNWKSKVKNFK